MGSAASTSSNGEAGKPRALIVCHASQESSLRALLQAANDGNELSTLDDVVIMTDKYPRGRQHRAELVSQTQAVFVAIDPMLQRSSELIETLSFLKDQRKTVISGPLTFFSRPSGAIGAVCLALSHWDPLLFERFTYWADKYELLKRSELNFDESLELESVAIGEAKSSSSPQVFFVSCEDLNGEASLILDKFAHNNPVPGELSLSGQIVRCQYNLESDLAALRAANVVVLVITEACTTSDDTAQNFRHLVEHALAWGKPIVPIKEQRAPLHGWLALAMAGRLWYQVETGNLGLIETKYADIPDCPCKVKDSCLATDFAVCVNGLVAAPQRTLERSQVASYEEAALRIAKERAQVLGLSAEAVATLCSHVAEFVNLCTSNNAWNLAELGITTTRQAVEVEATELVDVLKPDTLLPVEETAKSKELQPLPGIHYVITRMGFAPLPTVLDTNGLPIVGLQLDTMFSYQWGSQATVLDVYQQGHNLRAWFDVYGHMQGNVNSAMAAAVESVSCIIIFLTKAYLSSMNCRLEFVYAAQCRKPMIFAYLEDPETLELPHWVLNVTKTAHFNVYPSLIRETVAEPSRVLALDMRAERYRGVPMTDVLFSAVRRFAAWRMKSPLSIVYDGSLLLYATTSVLHHTLVRAASEGKEMLNSTLCTRCGASFCLEIPATLEGCRRHTAYYIGGTLITGRWVCCQETNCDGPGCRPSQHMTTERKWTLDPAYGTYTYEPNP